MGRPTVTEQRRQEVLEAFVRCVARYGLNGATLERLAEESGFKRPLIRHHLGNREEMVQALVIHVITSFHNQQQQIRAYLEGKERLSALLELLFSENTRTDADLILAFAALTAQAGQDVEMRKKLLSSLLDFEQLLQQEVQSAYPDTNKKQVNAVAQAIMALYFNLDSLSQLQPPQQWRSSARNAIDMLLDGLTGGEV